MHPAETKSKTAVPTKHRKNWRTAPIRVIPIMTAIRAERIAFCARQTGAVFEQPMKTCFSRNLLCTLLVWSSVVTAFPVAGQVAHLADTWSDTAGRPLNAHGGGVLFHQGVYYWYGEAKTGKTYLPDCNRPWGGTRVDLTGVTCYSSTNLSDWKDEGIVLAAMPADPRSDLHPSKVLERPKVVFNRHTQKFVMWMHIDSMDYGAARSGVAVSDQPTGPYKYLGSFRPDAGVWPVNAPPLDRIPSKDNPLVRDFASGQMARDQTVFVDDDGKAYLFYSSEENVTMHVSLLTDDYLQTSGKYARIFIGRSMEAPAVFKYHGKYYFIGSGCTSWAPNAARSAVADSPYGPWTELGNPCAGPGATNTFNTQSTFVVALPGQDRFIFIADRWNQSDLPASSYLWLPLEMQADGSFRITMTESGKTVKAP
jgi:hypothetical protein